MKDTLDKKILPEGWKIVSLKDVCEKVLGGGTPSTKVDSYWQGEIPWVSSADIFGLKDIRPKRAITELAIKKSATNLLPKGGIIVVTRVGLGKIAIAPYDLCFSQDNQGLIVDPRYLDKGYALIYLSVAVQRFKHESRGTTINGVTKKQLIELQIPLPPIIEQQKIVSKLEELFSELDKGIENLKTAQQQLKVYRQAVLKWAFEGRLTNEVVKDGELPKGWENLRIGDICDVVRGGSPRPAGDPQYYDGGIPFLKVGDLTKDDRPYLYKFEYTIKEAGLKKTRKISPKTLLLSNSGATLGIPKVCMIDATINDGIAAFIRLDEKSLLYVYYFWVSQTRHLRAINQGAAQPNLNTTIIRETLIPYCQFLEQDQIVQEIESRLSVCDKMEETINNSLKEAEGLRQSILKKAFEGKLI